MHTYKYIFIWIYIYMDTYKYIFIISNNIYCHHDNHHQHTVITINNIINHRISIQIIKFLSESLKFICKSLKIKWKYLKLNVNQQQNIQLCKNEYNIPSSYHIKKVYHHYTLYTTTTIFIWFKSWCLIDQQIWIAMDSSNLICKLRPILCFCS